MADQLCTPAQVKTRAGITDATDDALISEIVDQVSDEIEQFTGRKLVPEAAQTYTFDTVAGHVVYVPRGIRAVTTLETATSDQPDTDGAYTAVTASSILLRPLPAMRRPGWPATEVRILSTPTIPLRTVANGARIVGDFGFAATPPSVVRIAVEASLAEYLDRRRAGQGGPDAIDLPKVLQDTDLAVLARFRAGIGIG